MLDEEEHLEQNLLSAGAIGMDGENNQLKMLRCSRVIVIFTSLAKRLRFQRVKITTAKGKSFWKEG